MSLSYLYNLVCDEVGGRGKEGKVVGVSEVLVFRLNYQECVCRGRVGAGGCSVARFFQIFDQSLQMLE